MTSILFEIERIRRPRFKCNYLENQKLFLILLTHFWNLNQISNVLKKKIIVIATLLWNLQAVKKLVKLLSKKHCFRTPFDSQHVKGSQTLVKFAWVHFRHVSPSL